MSLLPTFSRRKRAATNPSSDVYVYDKIDGKLRIQVVHILRETIGEWEYGGYVSSDQQGNIIYQTLAQTLRKEVGVHYLTSDGREAENEQVELFNYMLSVSDVDAYLDALELSLRTIDNFVRANPHRFPGRTKPDAAIAEINARFLEAGIGFQYQSKEIIQIDSLLLHKGVVVPALVLTNNPKFHAVNGEYLKAHEAYRHADYETCLTECAKAFESTLKVLAKERGWQVQETDPAAKLIDAGVKAGFLQTYVSAGFSSLRSMLESGVPPMRNKTAAHGAGTTARIVPQELASFQLHQTAATIVFLIESHTAQP